jgi:histone H3-like centromeric protein A
MSEAAVMWICNHLIMKLLCFSFSFSQVKDIGEQFIRIGEEGLRWQAEALLALQEAAESYLVHLFEDA